MFDDLLSPDVEDEQTQIEFEDSWDTGMIWSTGSVPSDVWNANSVD